MDDALVDKLLERLRTLRSEHGLTQEQFAEKAGLTYKHYQAVEAGRKRDMRLSTLCRLAAALGLEPHQLLMVEKSPSKAVAKTRAGAGLGKAKRSGR